MEEIQEKELEAMAEERPMNAGMDTAHRDGRYASVSEMFSHLHAEGLDYLVMRNYENLLTPSFFLDGHPDIDMLSASGDDVARCLGAMTTRKDRNGHFGDGTHYYVFIDGRKVSIDLRHLGDGYYCSKWQKDALQRRKLSGAFYVMDDEDYFYTLLYHAILQKPRLTEEYRRRLQTMALGLGISLDDSSEKGLVQVLLAFMKKRGYTFSYPEDETVPLRTSLIDKGMVESCPTRMLRHRIFEAKVKTIDWLVRLKHIFS